MEDYVAITLSVNERERLFGFEVSKFDTLQTIQLDLEPFALLWLTSMDFKLALPDWKYGPFLQIDADDTRAKMADWLRVCSKLERIFADSPAPLAACAELRSRLEAFAAYLPVIEALRTPGLKDRHWHQLSATLGHDIRPEASLTLQLLVELGVNTRLSACTAIAEVAGKEHSFERGLERMRNEWSDVALDMAPYKDSGTCILRSLDDITLLLDDHILKAQVAWRQIMQHIVHMFAQNYRPKPVNILFQAMRGSPFVKPLEKAVVQWFNLLLYTQEVLDAWTKVQTAWLYLEPVFASPDIMRQLPREGRKFAAVDKMFRATMAKVTPERLS